jgi:hypothetical protein
MISAGSARVTAPHQDDPGGEPAPETGVAPCLLGRLGNRWSVTVR